MYSFLIPGPGTVDKNPVPHLTVNSVEPVADEKPPRKIKEALDVEPKQPKRRS